jgi:hypothetical protein
MRRRNSAIEPTNLLSFDGGGIIGTVTAPGDPWPRTRESAIAAALGLGARLAVIDLSPASGNGASRRRAAARSASLAPGGPVLLGPSEARRLGREHLAVSIEEARTHGLPAGGWVPRGVGPRALEKFARRFPCVALVLPKPTTWGVRARLRGDAPAGLRRLAEQFTLVFVDEESGKVRVAGVMGPVRPPAQKAYVLVQTTPDRRPIAPLLRCIPGVVSAQDVRGPFDALVVARSDSSGQLLQRILREIRSAPGVIRALAAPIVPSPVGPRGASRSKEPSPEDSNSVRAAEIRPSLLRDRVGALTKSPGPPGDVGIGSD